MVTSEVLLYAVLFVLASEAKTVAMNTAPPSGTQKHQQNGTVNSGFDPAPSATYIVGPGILALRVPAPGIPAYVSGPQRRVAGIHAVAWGKICAQKPSLCRRPVPIYHRRPRPWYKPDSEKSYWSKRKT